MIEFFMAMKPPTITAQEKKVTFKNSGGRKIPVMYDPPELKMAKVKLRTYLIPHIPDKPFDGPLRVIVKWCFPIPKTGKHYDGEYKSTKPDTGNLNKALLDVMEDLKFYVNDSRIASEITEKFYSNVPGIYIKIEEL